MRQLSDEDLTTLVDDYKRDGFAYVRQLFTPEELSPLAAALDPGGGSPGAFAVTDSEGGQQELSAWMSLNDDFIGVVPRLEPLVAAATAVIGEPVYHWHSKLSWKRPASDSQWNWHQDYGFWAEEGAERNAMCTIAVAIAPVTASNGCMRLVAGSHRLGRLDVVPVGQSRASDPSAVKEALATHRTELCELDTGDMVIFDGNTLHASGANVSRQIRTMLMSSYNAVSNPPSAPIHPGHAVSELHVLPAAAIADGWDEIFGRTPFVNPSSTGTDYGYTIGAADNQPGD